MPGRPHHHHQSSLPLYLGTLGRPGLPGSSQVTVGSSHTCIGRKLSPASRAVALCASFTCDFFSFLKCDSPEHELQPQLTAWNLCRCVIQVLSEPCRANVLRLRVHARLCSESSVTAARGPREPPVRVSAQTCSAIAVGAQPAVGPMQQSWVPGVVSVL